jgi:predicted transcriptional regulator of viral defense system
VHRGIYCVVKYPPTDHQSLVVVWLWTAQAGVYSHESALALHICLTHYLRRCTSPFPKCGMSGA